MLTVNILLIIVMIAVPGIAATLTVIQLRRLGHARWFGDVAIAHGGPTGAKAYDLARLALGPDVMKVGFFRAARRDLEREVAEAWDDGRSVMIDDTTRQERALALVKLTQSAPQFPRFRRPTTDLAS